MKKTSVVSVSGLRGGTIHRWGIEEEGGCWFGGGWRACFGNVSFLKGVQINQLV